MKKTIQFFTLVGFAIMIIACSADDNGDTITNSYKQTIVSSNINNLYEAKGSVTQDTVIVYAEGGPEQFLLASDIEEPQFSNYYRVYAKQAQQINSTITSNEITFDQAIIENSITTDIYQQVLEHFVNQDKVVIAMSHSYGAFILANVLATKPNIADKYIIMGGRLDMPDVVWQGFRDGRTYTFINNGTTPTADGGAPNTGGDLSITRLQAGLGFNRFTELLADKNLTNLAYIYGEYDEPVGRLTNDEIQFLENKDVGVLKIDEGGHSAMFHPEVLNFILNLIIREEE